MAGGFIGGHLVKNLMDEGNKICADIKPLEFWFQIYDQNENHSLDLKSYDNCHVTNNGDYIYNMACIWVVWVLLRIIRPNAFCFN